MARVSPDERTVPVVMPIEVLVSRSSVGGETDPELDDVCTDADAADFIGTVNLIGWSHVL